MSTDGSHPAPPTQIVIHERSSAFGRYGKWLALALVMAIVAIISLYGRYQSYFSPADVPQEKYHSLARYAPKKIAIINVSGTIWDVEDGFVKKQIDRVAEDPGRRGGGAADQFAWRHDHRQRLPVSPPERDGRRSANCQWW